MPEEINSNTVLWKDRKRIFGLPLSFTKYYIKNGRLYTSSGFFNTVENECLLYRILDIKLDRTLGNKIVGVGSITLFTCDETDNQLKVIRVKHPQVVRDLISSLVEEKRQELKLAGREIYGVGDGDGDTGLFN